MRPLNLGETLDASIKIVRARWQTLALVMLVIALPIQIANMRRSLARRPTSTRSGRASRATATAATTYCDEGAYVAGQTIRDRAGVPRLPARHGRLLPGDRRHLPRARRPARAASLRLRGRRLGATLWLTSCSRSGCWRRFIALFLPGIWLLRVGGRYPVMLVEGDRRGAALKRSFQLVQARWWATAGRMAVSFILVGVVTVVARLVFLAPRRCSSRTRRSVR